MEEEKELDPNNTEEDYEELFKNLGFVKSKKLVNYLMYKVMKIKDYKNPERRHIMNQLHDMKMPYRNVFNKDFI